MVDFFNSPSNHCETLYHRLGSSLLPNLAGGEKGSEEGRAIRAETAPKTQRRTEHFIENSAVFNQTAKIKVLTNEGISAFLLVENKNIFNVKFYKCQILEFYMLSNKQCIKQ